MLTMASAVPAYLRIGSSTARLEHIASYAILAMFEWVVFAFSLWHSDTVFVSYVSQATKSPRSLLLDVPVALLLCAASFLVEPVMVRVLGQAGWVSTQGMRPGKGLEAGAWIVLSISAGICEETVFRGYLQQQFSAWTGRVSVGVLGQAAVFGLVHGYQGWKNMVLIFVLGCIYGIFVLLRKELRANMIAHAVVDSLAAF
jgi:membrane protease YdiL (CAAX protease family)